MELLDQAIAEVIGTFDDVEEISAGLREDIVIIFKGSIGYGKSLLVSYWEVVTRILILALVSMTVPLVRVESIFFNLFWNVNFFVAAKKLLCFLDLND